MSLAALSRLSSLLLSGETLLAEGRLLLWPDAIQAHLDAYYANVHGRSGATSNGATSNGATSSEGAGVAKPNLWQVQQGVFRMLHRVIFRSESIGNSESFAVRDRPLARLLHIRAVRLPVLRALRAVAPLDFSGLASDRDRIVRHLLLAHHDGNQFAYDFELLRAHPGALEEVRQHATAIALGDKPFSEFWKDIAIFEAYHENLVAAVTQFQADPSSLLTGEERADPDISFEAYLRWCADQPKTPRETFRAFLSGKYTVANGIQS